MVTARPGTTLSHIDMDYLITYMATMDTEPDPMARPTTIHMAHNDRDDLASHTDTVLPTFYTDTFCAVRPCSIPGTSKPLELQRR